MPSLPNFTNYPKHTTVLLAATANTNRDGSTGTYSAAQFLSASGGSRVDKIRIVAVGTTTAGVVRGFYAADGATWRLVFEQLVTAITPSATIAVFSADVSYSDGFFMPPIASGVIAASWKFSTNNAESFVVHVMGGDF